jgi:hypothetical protein
MNIARYAGPVGLLLLACGGRTIGSSSNTNGTTPQDSSDVPDGGAGTEAGVEVSASEDAGPGEIAEAGTGVTPVSPIAEAGCAAAGGQPTQPLPVPLPSGSSCAATTEAIATWSLGGTGTSQYQSGFDSSTSCNGVPSLHLASSTATGSDFGEMGHAKTPGPSWLGQRLRLSGWVQSSAVTGWAGLWMRVDSATQSAIAFDNMQCRSISGTTGWALYQVVLDVPVDADRVAYGILLSDQGQVWLDGASLDVVDDCVPTTGCP